MREKEQIETIEPEFWETLSDKQKEAVRHIAKRYRPDGVGR
jgi:TRAP-type C4-dicarboxylate transport system substrate-binding protein